MLKNRWILLAIAVLLGVAISRLPRPEGTKYEIGGDAAQSLAAAVQADFRLLPAADAKARTYQLEALRPGAEECTGARLQEEATRLGLEGVSVEYMEGLAPKALVFLAMLAFLVFLFVFEPVPLEITAILIGVLLIVTGVADVKDAWSPYMHPVVVFIMTCLVFAIALDKVGLTVRLGQALGRRVKGSVVKFTVVFAFGLGVASTVMHDAAATAIGIAVMLPLMRAVGIEPHTNTARFMLLSIPFAASCGGMGTLVGGGRCMVSAAFLKEFTGIELSFFDWTLYALPAAIITIPISTLAVYLVFRPDSRFRLPSFDEKPQPWSTQEKRTLLILCVVLVAWLTKGLHGLDYSVTGMLGVTALVLTGILKWDDIHQKLEWGTALFIFGGGLSLGLAMEGSGAARYFAYLVLPFVQGGGWLLLFVGIGVFSALVTNVMANVAAAALLLPIAIPLAQLEGVDPRVIALCLGMCTSFAMLLVIGCPPNAIAYSYGQFSSRDLSKAGALTLVLCISALVGVVSIWWKVLGLV